MEQKNALKKVQCDVKILHPSVSSFYKCNISLFSCNLSSAGVKGSRDIERELLCVYIVCRVGRERKLRAAFLPSLCDNEHIIHLHCCDNKNTRHRRVVSGECAPQMAGIFFHSRKEAPRVRIRHEGSATKQLNDFGAVKHIKFDKGEQIHIVYV